MDLEMFSQLKEFMESLCEIIGVVACLFGIISLGMSLSSHDTQQRLTGWLSLAGGAIIYFAPSILAAMGIV